LLGINGGGTGGGGGKVVELGAAGETTGLTDGMLPGNGISSG